MRERLDTPRTDDGLKILLVGELACNADHVLALDDAGWLYFFASENGGEIRHAN
ncbi:MAG TPA: hypothetical protein VGO51_16545 [Burkholderiaceae bacterium]|jgi:hypothetical protein|nr:hypothetical protein [Burkholderiaceae bacterium]